MEDQSSLSAQYFKCISVNSADPVSPKKIEYFIETSQAGQMDPSIFHFTIPFTSIHEFEFEFDEGFMRDTKKVLTSWHI